MTDTQGCCPHATPDGPPCELPHGHSGAHMHSAAVPAYTGEGGTFTLSSSPPQPETREQARERGAQTASSSDVVHVPGTTGDELRWYKLGCEDGAEHEADHWKAQLEQVTAERDEARGHIATMEAAKHVAAASGHAPSVVQAMVVKVLREAFDEQTAKHTALVRAAKEATAGHNKTDPHPCALCRALADLETQ